MDSTVRYEDTWLNGGHRLGACTQKSRKGIYPASLGGQGVEKHSRAHIIIVRQGRCRENSWSKRKKKKRSRCLGVQAGSAVPLLTRPIRLHKEQMLRMTCGLTPIRGEHGVRQPELLGDLRCTIINCQNGFGSFAGPAQISNHVLLRCLATIRVPDLQRSCGATLLRY